VLDEELAVVRTMRDVQVTGCETIRAGDLDDANPAYELRGDREEPLEGEVGREASASKEQRATARPVAMR